MVVRILLKAALAHCAGVQNEIQNEVLGSFHHLIGVMQTVGAVLLVIGSKNRRAGQKILSNLTSHDQGREAKSQGRVLHRVVTGQPGP